MQIRCAGWAVRLRGFGWLPVLLSGTLGLGFPSCKKGDPVSVDDEPPEIAVVRIERRGPGYDQLLTAPAIDFVYRNTGRSEVASIKTNVVVFNNNILTGQGTQTLKYQLAVRDTVGHRVKVNFSEQPNALLGGCYEYTTEATGLKGAVATYRSPRICR